LFLAKPLSAKRDAKSDSHLELIPSSSYDASRRLAKRSPALRTSDPASNARVNWDQGPKHHGEQSLSQYAHPKHFSSRRRGVGHDPTIRWQ
jgi:hypothetical protein